MAGSCMPRRSRSSAGPQSSRVNAPTQGTGGFTMNSNKRQLAALLVTVAFAPLAWAQDKAKAPAPAAAPASAASHKMWAAKDLDWKDLPSIAGAKIAVLEGPMNEAGPFIARIKMP